MATPSPSLKLSALWLRPAALVGRCNLGERFGALTYRDYRLLFFGQAVSSVGGWMQMIAQGWLVYALTGSSFWLGAVALARAVPVFVFSLIGGSVADRCDRRFVIAVANGATAVLAFILGILAWTNLISVWHVVVIAFLMGAAFSFEVPCRQALISDIVDEKDLVSAVGLNSVAFNTAAVIGPALAGVLILYTDEGALFMLNGASYLAVVATVLMTRPGRCAPPSKNSLMDSTLNGLRYVWRTPELLALVSLMAITSLLARPYIQLLPVFARDVLEIGAAGLGALNSAAGGGALVAAVAVAVIGTFRRRGLFVALVGMIFGLALVVFAMSANLAVSFVATAILGFCSTFSSISVNTMLQANSDPRMRGRVMGLHSLTMMGIMPLGTMLEGALGSLLGVPMVLLIGGGLTAAAGLFIAVRARRLRALN
ncbi:MAG: MFS transporter [Chloroflexota bacterium]|nr:MFS transporter [Chloroflexota bacterium]